MTAKILFPLTLLLLLFPTFGFAEKRPCTTADLKTLGLEKGFSAEQVHRIVPVEKGQGLSKKTQVGNVVTFGPNCLVKFISTDGTKTFDDLSGFEPAGQKPCTKEGNYLQAGELIGRANKKFEGWEPQGTALSNPAHYAKKWYGNWAGERCNALSESKATGCVGSCLKMLENAGKQEFCERVLPSLLKIDAESKCKSCCP